MMTTHPDVSSRYGRPVPGAVPLAFERRLTALLEGLGIRRAGWTPYRFRCETRARGEGPEEASPRLVVGAVKAFVDEHVAEGLDLEQLARAAHLSKYHFARTFRDAEGITPWAYVQRTRVQRAKALLDAGFSLAEAALAAGFYDQSHFTNTFKRIEGLTPGQYRQKRKDLQEAGGTDE